MPSTTREQQRLDSWSAVQAAALALVTERGFDAVTVEDIAASAGVSRRTFFNHFPTKAAALFDPADDDATRLTDLLGGADVSAGIWPGLRDALVAWTRGELDMLPVRRRLIADDPELDAYNRTAHRHVGTALADWSRQHHPDDPFTGALVAETAAAVLITAFLAWDPAGDPASFPELVGRGFDLVGGGFVAPRR